MLLIRNQIWLRFRYFFLSVTIVPFIFTGCVNIPKGSSREFQVNFGKVGILSISTPSQLTFSPYADNFIAGALKGTSDVAVIDLNSPEYLYLSGLLFGPCWPLAAGAIITLIGISSLASGIYGVTHTIPPKTAKLIEQELRESHNISELSKELADRIYEFSSSEVGFGKYEVVRLGTFISEESLSYEKYAKLGIDNILIIKVKEANIIADIKKDRKLLFYLLAEACLVKTKDGNLIFKKDYSYHGELPYNQEGLLDDIKTLNQRLDEAVNLLAFRIINDLFIINSFPFYDDPLSTKIDRPEYGSCWFYPIYPKIQYQTPTSSFLNPGINYKLLYPEVDSLQPLLQWESFPRPRDQITKNDAIIHKISNVSYDLLIWEINNNKPEHLICYRNDLKESQYKLDLPLKPNQTYFWTFRASYFLNGKPNFTRWSYSWLPKKGLSRNNPCELDLIPNDNYYRFITPSENQPNSFTVYADTKITEEDENGNIANNKNISDITPAENQIKLAILPFHFYEGHVKYAGPIKGQAIEAIGEALKANNKFYPSYSYYDLGHGLDVRVIDDEDISSNSPDQLWTDKKFRPKTPNVNLSCEIGKELGVNVVFLGSVVAASEYEYNLDFYLLDVTSRKIYKRSDKIPGARLNSEIKLFTKQFFSSYSMN